MTRLPFRAFAIAGDSDADTYTALIGAGFTVHKYTDPTEGVRKVRDAADAAAIGAADPGLLYVVGADDALAAHLAEVARLNADTPATRTTSPNGIDCTHQRIPHGPGGRMTRRLAHVGAPAPDRSALPCKVAPRFSREEYGQLVEAAHRDGRTLLDWATEVLLGAAAKAEEEADHAAEVAHRRESAMRGMRR